MSTKGLWEDLEESENAFPSDWIKQCEIAENAAIEDAPEWTHAHSIEGASFHLWIGVFAGTEIPKTVDVPVIAQHAKLTLPTSFSNGGCVVTDNDGKEVTGYDVVVRISCKAIRKLLKAPRKKH